MGDYYSLNTFMFLTFTRATALCGQEEAEKLMDRFKNFQIYSLLTCSNFVLFQNSPSNTNKEQSSKNVLLLASLISYDIFLKVGGNFIDEKQG